MPMSGSQNGAEKLSIDVVSDVVCPWCFIGKRRLEKAIAMKPEIAVAVRWHPFFLNPWIPREGVDRKIYLETKFGSADGYEAIAQRVAGAAAAEGLTYAIGKIGRQPNTLDCHRLILWAQTMGGEPSRMKQRLMDLYFTEGADLTDHATLVRAARECGLDGERIRKLLDSDTDVDAVERQAQSAKEAGIEGVPCFIFGGALAVSGAQAPDHLASAIERAAAQREQAGKAEANS
jgi:predicted DsbA family dithiol-disulfide isomerase